VGQYLVASPNCHPCETVVRTPRKPMSASDLSAEALRSIEERLPAARPRQRARLLRRAGDVCASSGRQREALRWYGQAIDDLLELADAETASVLCRMILYVQPEAVRARCTLSWLDLTSQRYGEAAQRIREYVKAAEAAEQEELAAQQLGWMFDAAAPSPELRAEIVRLLFDLGMHARKVEAPAETSAAAAEERNRLWAKVLEGVLAGEPDPPDGPSA
jgi:hypothetical protein